MLLVFVLCLSSTLSAQDANSFVFNSELVTLPENIETFEWDQMPESAKLGEGYFGWVQFYQTPNQEVQNYFNTNSIQLLDYLGNGAYSFYILETTPISALAERGVRSIVPIAGRFKLNTGLLTGDIPEHAKEGDRFLVSLEFYKNVNAAYVISNLATLQIEVKQQYGDANYIDLVIPNNCLDALSNLPYVRWVEFIAPPAVKEDVRGKSIHRSNGLDTQMVGGLNYTGEGIGILVRDDGVVGPHIDFQGRIVNIPAGASGSHGDGVAGIFAGAGNLNPRYRGMAAGSDVYISNYQSNFLDTATQNLITSGDAFITNSSYGDGCNGGYTNNARIVDQQTNDHPSVMHVFSAGNSNGSDCGYGAGGQWGNITGGHKQGKNVIATANVFYNGVLASSSSHGPARDGRIKPDITAHGQGQISTAGNNGYQSFGGTSGAAPGIAGVSAQLYELYSDTHGGTIPPSGLVKASLLNTANDAGNVGPDYKFGWGLVNGLRAGNLLSEDRFITQSISNGDLNIDNVTVPAGTSQMRIMIYWTDPAAAVGASPALVNDLDLVVKDPSDASYLPWILDPTPNPTTLDLPATNGADHLNNMEQVLINNPAAGLYAIEVTGFDIPFGPQEYFIVYEFIQEQLTVVYPNYKETIVPGEEEVIHWDAINTTEDFVIEYSTDNGSTWSAVATVDAELYNYTWTVPETVTGQARVRVTSGTFSDESDNNFSVALQTTDVAITQVCDSSVTVYWDEVADAESYDIYVLGAKFMELVSNSTETFATIPISSSDDPVWVSIAARNDTAGWVGLRTNALKAPGDGLYNCNFVDDLAVESIDTPLSEFNQVCGPAPVTISATFFNVSADPQSGFEVSYQIDSEPLVIETFTGTIDPGNLASFDFATPANFTATGSYSLTISVNLPTDANDSNNEQDMSVYVALDPSPISDFEGFQTTGFPSEGWSIDNPDGGITWGQNSFTVGSDGASTRVGLINNFSYSDLGQEDAIVTEVYDLVGADVPGLVFDLAKAQRTSSSPDALRVEISTDCGDTYTVLYDKTGSELSTIAGFRTTSWFPTSQDDWRIEEIDLAAYIGEQVQFRFVNVTGNGNLTYIDNVNVLNNYLGTEDQTLSQLALYPNPAQDAINIALNQQGYNKVDVFVTNGLGQQVITQPNITPDASNIVRLNVASLRSGIYFVTINIDGAQSVKKLSIR